MTTNRIAGLSQRLGAVLTITAVAWVLAAREARAAEGDFNACGCRQTGQGLCVCEKKSKCGCPGECEPKGCEEKRAKQLEKEIQAETKKAEETSRRQHGQAGGTQPTHKGPSEDADSSRAAAKAAPRMTGAQKKELAKLLGAYLAEHPDDGGKTIEQLRGDLGAPGTK
jgi:hypothetical protein